MYFRLFNVIYVWYTGTTNRIARASLVYDLKNTGPSKKGLKVKLRFLPGKYRVHRHKPLVLDTQLK